MSEVPTVSELRACTTVSVARAGAWLGMSPASAYRAAADGSLPIVMVGKTRRVPTPRLLALVGLVWEADPLALAALTPSPETSRGAPTGPTPSTS